MEPSDVRYEVKDGIATLTIDREPARNALSPQVLAGLRAGLERAQSDSTARVIVLTGAGTRVFCAGADLGGLSGDGFLAGHDGRRAYGQLLLALQTVSKPTVARINGHALAGGLGLVLACDLAVAVDSAGFGTPEIDRGLFPMMVIAFLQRHLGRKRALELALTGERITSEQALVWGLVNRVVPEAKLDETVKELAGKLAGKSLAILALGRRSFFTAEDLPLNQAVEFLGSQLSLNTLAEDTAEGVTAFLEKRPAKWADR
ncbi:MAG: enoyl-CoA hydratase/isomerase family protein [Myxococcaceae bacterium]|nr:enoyl-CoA hydratase/isomerase family protein [Myxococcaceae bacterium]